MSSEGGWRVGCVGYLNARPLVFAAPTESIIFDSPANLSARIQAGELDAALVPVFHVLKHPGYLVVDGYCIGCRGPVYSVVVAYDGDLEEIRGLRLSEESMTSNALARVVLASRGVRPRVVSAGLSGGAEVLIGDTAIARRLADPDGRHYLDLGTEWLRLTGLPFVFAVWAIREDAPNAAELATRLRACGEESLRHIPEITQTAPREHWPFVRTYLTQYIRYQFGENEKAGISEYQRRCINLCLLEETHPVRFI